MATFDTLADGLPWLRGRLLAGVSGGADSMALCRLLMCLRDRGHVVFEAIHVNHGLRGEASDADEAFVADFCRAQGIPLTVRRLTPPEHPGEGWAREARYAAFAQAMTQTGADALVLAHHRDDQAETMLMHLMRGAGLTGLCGMRAQSALGGMPVWRPLLAVPRAALRQLLTDCGQPWREDATNAADDYLRNRVRHQAMPVLERLAPGASARMARTAALLQPEEDLLSDMARRALGAANAPWLPVERIERAPAGLRPRMMRMWWAACFGGDSLDAVHTQALAALAEAPVGTACTLLGGRRGYRGYGFLHLLGEDPAPPAPQTVTGEGDYPLGSWTLRVTAGGPFPGDGRSCQALPRGLLAGCTLRTRQAGDFIRPFGMVGEQSLQDYLVNRRVDAPFRQRLPLLCKGREVLLAAGVGAGGVPRWQPKGDWLCLRWLGDMPWARANHAELDAKEGRNEGHGT